MYTCSLCSNNDSFSLVNGPDSRIYRECNHCKLISVEPAFHLSKEKEKERYLNHNNSINEEGYVNFLNTAIDTALPFLNKSMKGLDFGCGPTPTLSVILEQQGFACDNYDSVFFPDMPGNSYDFIFATECFEHFFSPDKEIRYIKNLLQPGGLLVIKTAPWKSKELFQSWYYARDETHVCFYHNQTFEFIAEKYKFQLIDNSTESVFMLRR